MYNDRLKNYQWLENDRNSKLIVYVTGSRQGMETQIDNDQLEYFSDHLDKIGIVNKITLFLYTQGGNTMTAWSLVNLIRQFCKEFEIIVPSLSRSSGTIICLGADKIMMTKQATLGPIDPSLNNPLNPPNPMEPNNPRAKVSVSVESIQGYFELAKQELEIKGEEHIKDILLNLSGKVHPLVLGDIYRRRSQIKTVATKLLTKQLGSEQQEKIEKIVSFLCSDSGSHDYAIYRREAKDELGLNIDKPNDDQYNIIKETLDSIREELQLRRPFIPQDELKGAQTVDYNCRRALIESIDGGTDVFVTKGVLNKKTQQIHQPPHPPIDRTTIENQIDFQGWEHEDH